MRISNLFLALAATSLLIAGCAKQRAPANDAIESVESSLAEVREDAARYAPDGLKGVESQLARLKTSLENEDYENVLAGAPQLQKAVGSLKSAIAASKAQAKAALGAAKMEWEGLNAEVPKMVESIQTRVDELSKRKRLPMGVSKDEFEGAKSGLEMIKTTWAEATAAANSGNQIEATNKAKTVKGMAEEVRDRLNIES